VGDILADVARVGAAVGAADRAAAVVAALEERIAAVRRRVAGRPVRRCVLLEWIDPPFRSGHWDPELVALAGGVELLGRSAEPATAVEWDVVRTAAPDALVIACCGYDVARTLADVPLLRARPGWAALPAVRTGDVWVVDGSAYFSRPGPRVVDSLELLAWILHPDGAPPVGDAAVRVG
jgi:iron complex transport system substrate-binding protein